MMDAPSIKLCLVLISVKGDKIPVCDGEIVGRSATGSAVLADFDGISRRHAQFLTSDGIWHVVDLESKNGVFLDGKRIAPRQMVSLKHGQKLRLADSFESTVRIEALEAAEETIKVDENRRSLVIMFVDLKGSTDYFQEQGTIVARNWIYNFYNMLSQTFTLHDGKTLKNIGDATLSIFEDPYEAARAAIVVQKSLLEHNAGVPEHERYELRIGINHGSVIYENNDVFGNAVNIAARVQSITPAGKIYVSETLYQCIKSRNEIPSRFVGNEQLKGVRQKVGIYELLLEKPSDDSTTKVH